MICPVCKSEYQSEITRCADCNIPLMTFEELSEQKQKQEAGRLIGNFGIIFSTPNADDARAVKNLLETHGIWPLILDDTEIKFFIHNEQRKQASDALKDYRESNLSDDSFEKKEASMETVDPEKKDVCSICGNAYRPKSNFCDQCGQPLTNI